MSSDKYSAAASTLGYLYQARYALYMLLNSQKDIELSLERFDDITFEREGEPIELIQNKHSLKVEKSLTDNSKELWTTLRIWSERVLAAQVDLEKVRFALVTTSNKIPDGHAVSKLRPDGKTKRDVEGAWDILSKEADKRIKSSKTNLYQSFHDLGPALQKKMLHSIYILDSSPNIIDVKPQILQKIEWFTRKEHVEPIFQRIEGWWFDRVIAHLAGKRNDRIKGSEVADFIQYIRDQFHTENLPIDFKDLEAPTEEKLESSERIFIRQLRFVDVQPPRIKTAIADYYRAYQQRSRWIREDLLDYRELENYDDRLSEHWRRLFDRMCEGVTPNDEKDKMIKGKDLYNDIEDSEVWIRPQTSEQYVMMGSYHMLANRRRVGWHRDFQDKIKKVLPSSIQEVT